MQRMNPRGSLESLPEMFSSQSLIRLTKHDSDVSASGYSSHNSPGSDDRGSPSVKRRVPSGVQETIAEGIFFGNEIEMEEMQV